MTTRDLQHTHELIQSADMAVRVSSQLRLWLIRRSIQDTDALERAIKFLDVVSSGGRFVESGNAFAGSADLEPLTWAADLRFSQTELDGTREPVEYGELVSFIDKIKITLISVENRSAVEDEAVKSAAMFFQQLGKHLGTIADEAMRTPVASYLPREDRFSFQ